MVALQNLHIVQPPSTPIDQPNDMAALSVHRGWQDRVIEGDCHAILPHLSTASVDLIVTSPPYADSRKNTYGGVSPDHYVEWFLPIAVELRRVLKPTGTFILNIKEKVVEGERHPYVLELILAMRKQGWLWTEEFVWHKKTATPASGRIVFVMRGNAACNLTCSDNSRCTRTRCASRWAIGRKRA